MARAKIYFQSPSKSAHQPSWANEFTNNYEVAEILLETLNRNAIDCGELLPVYFGDDVQMLAELIKDNLDPDFIANHVNTEFGRGVMIGSLIDVLQERVLADGAPADDEA